MKDFMTPPNHTNFLAKKLFAEMGEIVDGSIAYLEKDGGGPSEPHTHEHNHLFIVVKGEAKILLNNEIIIVKENDFYLLKGSIPHSVWNNLTETTIMIGISVKMDDKATAHNRAVVRIRRKIMSKIVNLYNKWKN